MFSIPLLEVVLCIAVSLAAAIDLMYRKVPNLLVLGGLSAALVLQLLDTGAAGALAWLGGGLTGLLLFLPHYLLRGMAAGDVKLMAMVGSFTAPLPALQICFASIIIGALLAVITVLWRGRLRATLRNMRKLLKPWLLRAVGVPLLPVGLAPGESVGGMPYAVAIAFGTVLVLLRT